MGRIFLRRPRPMANEGSRLLCAAMTREKLSQYRLAKERPRGELARGVVSRWLSGERRPDTADRVWLHQRFGVPILAWDEAVEARTCA